MTQEEIDALPDSLSVTFRTPLVLGSLTYSEITFREPTSGQLKRISTLPDMAGVIELMALTSDVPAPVIELMPARAFKKAAAFLNSFTQDAQRTGAVG